MIRVAVLGGGIAGLAAAYELEQQRKAGKPIDWHLYEASDRLGGTVQTTRRMTADGEYILEGGPDAWVTDKPAARELAEELGLGDEVIPCNEAEKKTYIWLDGALVAMPERMRMMVPEDLATLDASPLFSAEAKQAYAHELERAGELKASIPDGDESVASFVRRHFGEEVLDKIGAPLLSGVFGGDTARLSVRAVMSPFTEMEAEYGSLVAALQARRREHGDKPSRPTFTTLRRGLGSLVDAIVAHLPTERVHLGSPAQELLFDEEAWTVYHDDLEGKGDKEHLRPPLSGPFHQLFLATPLMTTRKLLREWDPVQTTLLRSAVAATSLLPASVSSAVLATFCWPAKAAHGLTLPPGFGFLVPQHGEARSDRPRILAGTFTTQKFPGRAPEGACVMRVFFGGEMAATLLSRPDEAIAAEAWSELLAILPALPEPDAGLTTVARWPNSLPQYEVGHLDRMAELERQVERLGHLSLLGNAYHGVGVPDLIRDARAAVRSFACR